MAILRDRISFNKSTWIIILGLFYISSQIVESLETNARENWKNIGASFDDDNLQEFHRLLRQLREKVEEPSTLTNFPSVQQQPRDSENSMIIGEEIRLAEIKESPMILSMDKKQWSLPEKFSYVAKEFYHSFWEKRKSGKNNSVGIATYKIGKGRTAEDEENSSESEESSTEMDSTTLATIDGGQNHGMIWRNIIGAPTATCPPGQRKDRGGRCRKALW